MGRSVVLWDLAAPEQPVARSKLHSEPVLSLAVTPDGAHVLSGAADDLCVPEEERRGPPSKKEQRLCDIGQRLIVDHTSSAFRSPVYSIFFGTSSLCFFRLP